MFSFVAPTLSYAAYFVDQTETRATNTRAHDVMGKKIRIKRALDAMAYAPANYNYDDEYFLERGIINQH